MLTKGYLNKNLETSDRLHNIDFQNYKNSSEIQKPIYFKFILYMFNIHPSLFFSSTIIHLLF